MHPWEDFAETFAHYLHITGTLADRGGDRHPSRCRRDEPARHDVVPLRVLRGRSRSSGCSATGSGCRRRSTASTGRWASATSTRSTSSSRSAQKLAFMHDIVTKAPLTPRGAGRPGGALGHGAHMTSVARGQRVIGAATHYVENQPPVRTDIDEYELNAPLMQRGRRLRGRVGARRPARGRAARRVTVVPARRDARERAHARRRIRTTAGASASTRWSTTRPTTASSPPRVARGAHTSAWADPKPGADVARAAMFMLFAQVEPGHACPVSMTHAAVASIKDSPWVADDWLPRLYSREYEPRLLPERGEDERADRHGDDREAGRLGRARGHDRRHVHGRSRVPDHRSQVVLLGADVGRLPRARPDAPRQRRRGAVVPVRAAAAAPRHAQRLPHPASEGQARQPLERVGVGRVRRDDRPDRRRAGPRRAHDHRDGAAHAAGLRAGHRRRHAAVRRRGGLARARARGLRQAARRSAGDDRGAGRSRARVRGGDAHRTATRAGVRGRGIRSRRRAAPARDTGLEVLGDQARTAARLRGAGVPRRQRLHRVVPARAALPRAAGHGDLGGLGQRDRARRAAGAHARPGLRRGVRRRTRRPPRAHRRCSTPTSRARSRC